MQLFWVQQCRSIDYHTGSSITCKENVGHCLTLDFLFSPPMQLLNAFLGKTESHPLQKRYPDCWRFGSVTRSWNRFYCPSHCRNMKIEIQFYVSKYWVPHLCFSCVWCQSLVTPKSEGWVVIYKNKKRTMKKGRQNLESWNSVIYWLEGHRNRSWVLFIR